MTLSKALLLGAALAAVACAAPVTHTGGSGSDPCAVLGALPSNQTTYEHVKSCYHSIEFNPAQAKTTLDSLHTLYNDFFVFRDAALTPDLAQPFSSGPVDILAGLEKIRQKKYTSDFEFHSDLRTLANSFNDAHVTYGPACYSSIAFTQPIALYAPIVNGRQAIRVYEDASNNNFKDCEVLTIDGQEAVSYVQSWVDRSTGYSKDAGVRFNYALATFAYDAESKTWSSKRGEFSTRTTLPDSPHVSYRLRCDAAKGDINHRVQWTVVPQVEFTDKASFLKNVCERAPTPAPETNPVAKGTKYYKRDHATELKEKLWKETHRREYEAKQRSVLSKRALGEAVPSPQDFDDAVFVAGNVTAVYQLKSKPHVGVLVVPTMMVETAVEVPTIQRYLTQLAERNVTHLIIDTFGNGGGDVSFASLLVQVLFPSQDKSTAAHLARYRASPLTVALAEADLKDTDYSSLFDPEMLADKTFTAFKTNPFLVAENITMNGREAAYTQEMYMNYDLAGVDHTIKHPWTGDASKVTLLTDGQCGSACGMFSDLLVTKHGVKAVAVGGHTNKDLSMFSFAGAAVIGLDQVVDAYEKLKIAPALQRLPYTNTVNVGFIEIYSMNDTMPLEYNPARYIAAHRLDYTPETARNHDQLWAAVAGVAWA
ncbi:hypothetical protein BGZ75_001184 [Mortierella antarctica]|nr:hypothetical protein BGZ75_001184 [Mortierella antarctica]